MKGGFENYSYTYDSYLQDRENEERRSRVETYDQKLERWKEGWNKELDDDLANGR